jgi:FMN phosphatase YigB (HAD superfamily)
MIDTFLFDLDGTLLPLSMERFMEIYFRELGIAFKDIMPPKKLFKYIWSATEAMIENVEYKTNEKVFMDHFSNLINDDINIYKKRFDHFYDHEFLKVKEAVSSMPLIRKSIDLLKEKGYKLVVATNPLFPQKAIYHRIKWADLNPDDFLYITSYENSHYCKPQIKYFEEILEKINKAPHQCIMVGNDVQEDLIASSLGMQTFLITNYMINRKANDINCNYKGTYEDFYQYVRELSPIITK